MIRLTVPEELTRISKFIADGKWEKLNPQDGLYAECLQEADHETHWAVIIDPDLEEGEVVQKLYSVGDHTFVTLRYARSKKVNEIWYLATEDDTEEESYEDNTTIHFQLVPYHKWIESKDSEFHKVKTYLNEIRFRDIKPGRIIQYPQHIAQYKLTWNEKGIWLHNSLLKGGERIVSLEHFKEFFDAEEQEPDRPEDNLLIAISYEWDRDPNPDHEKFYNIGSNTQYIQPNALTYPIESLFDLKTQILKAREKPPLKPKRKAIIDGIYFASAPDGTKCLVKVTNESIKILVDENGDANPLLNSTSKDVYEWMDDNGFNLEKIEL